MSAAPRHTIDIAGLALAKPVTQNPSHHSTSREVVKSVLANLTTNQLSEPVATNSETIAPSEGSEQKLAQIIASFDVNHTYSSVTNDTRGQDDTNKYEMYLDALPKMLTDLFTTMEIPQGLESSNNNVLTWNDHIYLRSPSAGIKLQLSKAAGEDVSRQHLAGAYTTIKRNLKHFFQGIDGWLIEKNVGKLARVEEKLKNVLAVVDSLKTIVERSPLIYPNRNILNQEPHIPAYVSPEEAKKRPRNQSSPVKTSSWKEINEMFQPITDRAQPFKEYEDDREEGERDIWQLHLTLAHRYYEELCTSLQLEQSPEINAQLAQLAPKVTTSNKTNKITETITKLLQEQVHKAESRSRFTGNLFEAKVSIRSLLEQLHTLKQVSFRTPSSMQKAFTKVKTWGSQIFQSIQNWWKPKVKTISEPTYSFFSRFKSLKTFGLIAGLASLTSFTAGQTKNPGAEQNPQPTPVASTPESPTAEAVSVASAEHETPEVEGMTESTSNENNDIVHSSIQRRLQNTFKSEAALSTFRTLYGQQLLNLSEKQKQYLGNTFAHVIRPHLRGFHSNTDTAPLHVTYLGSAPHHKHVFMVNSAGHSETVRVHIPSWENIARGLDHADVPAPTHAQHVGHVYTAPGNMESELASLVPPPPPGAKTDTVRAAIDIDAALDALNQADQLPPTPVATPTPEPSKAAPHAANAVAIALEELAQSDRNKNHPA